MSKLLLLLLLARYWFSALLASLGLRQQATIFPWVRSNKDLTNCKPMPRDEPVTTKTASGSWFRCRADATVPVLFFKSEMSGNTACPRKAGGGAGWKGDEDDEDEDAEEEDSARRIKDALNEDGVAILLLDDTKTVMTQFFQIISVFIGSAITCLCVAWT